MSLCDWTTALRCLARYVLHVLVWLQAFDLGLPNLLIQRIGAAHGCGDFKTVGEHFATGLAILGVICVIAIVVSGGLAFSLPGCVGLQGDEAQTLSQCFFVGGISMPCSSSSTALSGFHGAFSRLP